jgi:serine/threonine-protein kinase
MRTVGERYVLEGQLGAGAMGEVYRARHVHLGKYFALKVIAPTFANDTMARDRFNDEAKLASEISHPNIVSVVDFGEDPTLGAYMVMELVDGEPVLLADSSAPTPLKRAIDVLAQVADALECIHSHGIIHGDVKAENMMLCSEPAGTLGGQRRKVVRLLDFGLACRFGVRHEVVSGSPAYLAPERVTGGPATVATDIYALGALAYLLFTRSLPFDGPVVQVLTAQLHDEPEPISKRRGEKVPPAIENLVTRAMAKDPNRRHPTAASFRYEINTLMDTLDMRRRHKTSGAMKSVMKREAVLANLFDHSHLPQALVSSDGVIGYVNDAFGKLLGGSLEGGAIGETLLAMWLPELGDTLARARSYNTAVELRTQVSGLELCLWATPSPLGTGELHLLLRMGKVAS